MIGSTRKSLLLMGTLIIALTAGIGIGPLVRGGVSPIAAGIVVGILGTLCVVGIALGAWNALRLEARRKAREQIWMKH